MHRGAARMPALLREQRRDLRHADGFFSDTATTEIFTLSYPLSLHLALPIWAVRSGLARLVHG
eukprot:COSAG06_NODE_63947_length_261_cov_0.518519_1_plen_62_part_01